MKAMNAKRRTLAMAMGVLVTLALAWLSPMWAAEPEPTAWPTNWAWVAPEPPLPGTEWFDYGWDSTSNGPVSAMGQPELSTFNVERSTLNVPQSHRVQAPVRMTRHAEEAAAPSPRPSPPVGAREKETGLYADTFLTLKTEDFRHGEWGYGVGVGYQVSRHWGADVRLSHEGFDAAGSVIQDVGVRLVARMPFATWNPYTFLGSRYDFERDHWRIEPGAGVAIGTTVQWFAEGSLDADLHGRNGYKLASGVRFRF